MTDTLRPEQVESLVAGYYPAPFDILGPHAVETEGGPALVVRAFIPWAESMAVLLDDARVEMERVHPAGLFQATLPGRGWGTPYRLWARAADSWPAEFHDPYAFPSCLTDFDLYLIGEGTHHRTYEKLGAHIT